MARYETILETVGRTPIVRINRLAREGVRLYAKLEAFNPLGSVKDRMAAGVIEAAERDGVLSPGQTVIEATSGNTGIGLAMVCAAKGYPLVIVMAENFSVERRKIMRFLGARVVLTPATFRGIGMLGKAVELASEHGWFLCRQFENEANADAHTRTTAREILADFEGERLDYWVTGFGTGGTLKGVARVLREERPETKVILCEPDNSRILAGGMPQERLGDGSPAVSHPDFRTHAIQGWAPDFIPKLTEDALGYVSEILPVSSADAVRRSRELATREGIFTGISGGATFAGALKVSESAPEGSTILCMLPDTGERYLTTPLFDDVTTEMTGEEIEISKSTPNYRFDVATCPAPRKPAAPASPPTRESIAFVEEALSDASHPVVLFALEWCEFCWSVRRLFAETGVAYRSVDLDKAEFQRDGRGGKIRAALAERTASWTLPQVFIGGEFVGGCSELFDAYKEGRLQELLKRNRVPHEPLDVDPHTLLPSWLHPR